MGLVSAILSLLLLPCGEPVAHARRYPGGVEARAAELAEHFDQAAQTYQLDARLLVALAHSESGLDGTRVGAMGELGLMQLMPNTPAGRAYAAVRGPQTVRDGVAILLGAEALRHGLTVCGSEAEAVGWYKSGRCIAGPKVHYVLALRDKLRRGHV